MQAAPPMKLAKPFYLSLGWLCVALGGLGVIMPILPTTPFLLLAVWAFTRSSPELAEKIRSHPTFGPFIRDWQDHGVIPPAAKAMAIAMIAAASAYLIGWSPAPSLVVWPVVGIMAAATGYILTRPSRPS